MQAAELTDPGGSEVVPAVHLRGAGPEGAPRGHIAKSDGFIDLPTEHAACSFF